MENVLTPEIHHIVEYPGVAKRVKALITDGFILILLMILFSSLFDQFENVAQEVRIFVFVFVFFLYDPLLTSFTGATLGHRLFGLRVRDEQEPTKKISFFKAIIRFLIKGFLGWVSLLTVQGNEKRKAMHDMAVGSVVVEVGSV